MTPWKFKITCSRPMWCVFCWKTFQLVTFPLVFCCRSCRSVPRFHSPRAVLAVDDRSKWSPWSHPRSSGRKKKVASFCAKKKNIKLPNGSEKSSFMRSDLCSFNTCEFSKKSLAASCDVIQLYWFFHNFPQKSRHVHSSMMVFVPPILLPLELHQNEALSLFGGPEKGMLIQIQKKNKTFWGHWFFTYQKNELEIGWNWKMSTKEGSHVRAWPKEVKKWWLPSKFLPRWWVLSVTH